MLEKVATRVTVTLQILIDSSEVEKKIYEAIEDRDLKTLTELLDYCNSVDMRIRSMKLEQQ